MQAVTPDTLGAVVSMLNVSRTAVDRDLDSYRGLLNKLKSAKELLRDFLEREKKKQVYARYQNDSRMISG